MSDKKTIAKEEKLTPEQEAVRKATEEMELAIKEAAEAKDKVAVLEKEVQALKEDDAKKQDELKAELEKLKNRLPLLEEKARQAAKQEGRQRAQQVASLPTTPVAKGTVHTMTSPMGIQVKTFY